jgi:Flp pilus assembly protein TadB
MAQTKRKRRTKHRGTAAGTIETRGRTGRPPSPEERKKQTRMEARERRLNTPPTWRSAFTRAAIASVLLFALISLTYRKNAIAAAAGLALFALVLYTPAGYYLELWMYRRRQARKARPK